MTSHPKDATEKLFKTMAECEKCAHQLHLPVQSGSDRILRAMNRVYTREKYIEKARLARSYMPDLVITTDIIVGFPGETDEDFAHTLSLCEEIEYDAMFTFIYSKRQGTPAAEMPDPYTREDKQKHFDALMELSNTIAAKKHAAYVGQTLSVLVDGRNTQDKGHSLTARTRGGRLVHLNGDESLIGSWQQVKILRASTWVLFGELA
jgi:tRNA-2-methylthio-N6-dimethylallyladenosine synthase